MIARKGFYFILFVSWILCSCSPSLPEKIDNLNNGQITVVGHGGPGIQNMFSFVPLNTRKGFQKALKNPDLNGVEMDVQMSSDRKLVLFHDENLNKPTNGKGWVVEHSFNELLQYKYDADFFSSASRNHSIIGLESMLTELKMLRPQGTFVLDLKMFRGTEDDSKYTADYAQELVNVIHRTHTEKNACIESMNPFMLQSIQKIDSTLHLFFYTTKFDHGIEIAGKNKFYGITIKYIYASQQMIKSAHDTGLRVSLWGPRTRMANSKAIRMQPDYIQADRISDLLKKTENY